MAQCKALSNQLESAGDSQDYVLQLCLDQLDSDDILEHNDQFVVQNAYLFNNHYVLKTVRKELLTNPCGRLQPKVYAQLLFKVYDLISDMKNTEECAEVLSTLTINEDVK